MENLIGWVTLGTLVFLNIVASVRNTARMSAIQERLEKQTENHTKDIGDLKARVLVLESEKECQ